MKPRHPRLQAFPILVAFGALILSFQNCAPVGNFKAVSGASVAMQPGGGNGGGFEGKLTRYLAGGGACGTDASGAVIPSSEIDVLASGASVSIQLVRTNCVLLPTPQSLGASDVQISADEASLTYQNQSYARASTNYGSLAWQLDASSLSVGDSTPSGIASSALAENSVNGLHAVGADYGLAAGSGLQMSVLVRGLSRSAAWLQIQDANFSAGNAIGCAIDLSTGVTSASQRGSGSGVSCTSSDLGQGWYQVVLSGVPTASNSAVHLEIGAATGTGTGAGSYAGQDGVNAIEFSSVTLSPQ